jgi:hypothetical protein
MEPDPAETLNALIDRARAAVAGNEADADAAFPGTSADGLVCVEVGADGRLRSLRIDPKMLRRPLDDIAAEVVHAVNAALDARPARPDSAALLADLRSVQQESVQQMARIAQAFGDALARVQDR